MLLALALMFGLSTTSRASEQDPFVQGMFEHRGVILTPAEGYAPFRIRWECDQAYEVLGFDPAPCSGLLIPHAQADEAIKLKLVDFPQLQDEFRLYRVQSAIDLKEAEDALKIETEKNASLTKLLDRNRAPLDPPFYETFWFGASVGVVTTVIIVIAVSYAVGE